MSLETGDCSHDFIHSSRLWVVSSEGGRLELPLDHPGEKPIRPCDLAPCHFENLREPVDLIVDGTRLRVSELSLGREHLIELLDAFMQAQGPIGVGPPNAGRKAG